MSKPVQYHRHWVQKVAPSGVVQIQLHTAQSVNIHPSTEISNIVFDMLYSDTGLLFNRGLIISIQ